MFFFSLVSPPTYSNDFSASIENTTITLKNVTYQLNTNIIYHLSPTAKKALQKGIPLTWFVRIKVIQPGLIWDNVIKEISIRYQIRNHALLNLYSVETSSNDKKHMFSSLTVALDFISKIRNLILIDKQLLTSDINYNVSIKTQFSRESLPTPLRPMSYFDSQWALSSPWTLWPL
jgi:hypothetical protein